MKESRRQTFDQLENDIAHKGFGNDNIHIPLKEISGFDISHKIDVFTFL